MSNIESRYFDGSYLTENPDWGREDAPWKAAQVFSILQDNQISPTSICEVGCGNGDILVHLQKALVPSLKIKGYDISPQAALFWAQHNQAGGRIEFILGNFHELTKSSTMCC